MGQPFLAVAAGVLPAGSCDRQVHANAQSTAAVATVIGNGFIPLSLKLLKYTKIKTGLYPLKGDTARFLILN
jgi:hypothetical protein